MNGALKFLPKRNAAAKTDREQGSTLGLLLEIASREHRTQRHWADHCGAAPRFIKNQLGPGQSVFFLQSPRGLAEKSRRAVRYPAYSFDFYGRASADMLEVTEQRRTLGVSSVLVAGVSELAEIGSIRMQDAGLELLGTVDPNSGQQRFLGHPLWTTLEETPASEVAVFTSISPDPVMHARLLQRFGEDRVRVPRMLQGLPGADVTTSGIAKK